LTRLPKSSHCDLAAAGSQAPQDRACPAPRAIRNSLVISGWEGGLLGLVLQGTLLTAQRPAQLLYRLQPGAVVAAPAAVGALA
jgi:hypothetical protein